MANTVDSPDTDRGLSASSWIYLLKLQVFQEILQTDR